jgi:hypothetical protein
MSLFFGHIKQRRSLHLVLRESLIPTPRVRAAETYMDSGDHIARGEFIDERNRLKAITAPVLMRVVKIACEAADQIDGLENKK